MTIANSKKKARPISSLKNHVGLDVVRTEGLYVLIKDSPNSATWWVLDRVKNKEKNEQGKKASTADTAA